MINRRLFATKPSRLERFANVALACAIGAGLALVIVYGGRA
jgi:uncharacterized membrane protein YgaE (UPF0421/DUF939 family)